MCMKLVLPAFSQIHISRSFDSRPLLSGSLGLLWAYRRQVHKLTQCSHPAAAGMSLIQTRHLSIPMAWRPNSTGISTQHSASLAREMAGTAILWWDLWLSTANTGFIPLLGRFVTSLRIHSAYSSCWYIYIHALGYSGS